VDLRAADVDRNRAVDVLQRATAEGYLTLDEFEVALDRAFSARTYSELDALLAGIPGSPRPSVDWAPQPVRPSPGPAAAAASHRRPAWVLPSSWSLLRVALAILAAAFVLSLVIHAWPLPLLVFGFIWWKRSHHQGHCWPGYRRRWPAETA